MFFLEKKTVFMSEIKIAISWMNKNFLVPNHTFFITMPKKHTI
jgi:hypothetical protein